LQHNLLGVLMTGAHMTGRMPGVPAFGFGQWC
jgi:hypothetical protein